MKNVLIVEVPTVNDETVTSMQKLFFAFMKAFEDHYAAQLSRYSSRLSLRREEFDDDPPF
jgi:hypothetical protein